MRIRRICNNYGASDVNRCNAAAQGLGYFVFVAQQPQHMGCADRARVGQAPEAGPANQYGARAQGQRLQHIGAAPDAAVHQ